MASLVIVVSAVLVLSYGETHSHKHTHTHTHTHTHRQQTDAVERLTLVGVSNYSCDGVFYDCRSRCFVQPFHCSLNGVDGFLRAFKIPTLIEDVRQQGVSCSYSLYVISVALVRYLYIIMYVKTFIHVAVKTKVTNAPQSQANK